MCKISRMLAASTVADAERVWAGVESTGDGDGSVLMGVGSSDRGDERAFEGVESMEAGGRKGA